MRREVARITDVRRGARGHANLLGIEPGLAGTLEQIAERILEFEKVGVDLLLLQFSPQLEKMEPFAEEAIGSLAGT